MSEKSQGEWRTVNGAHVFIAHSGEATKGPHNVLKKLNGNHPATPKSDQHSHRELQLDPDKIAASKKSHEDVKAIYRKAGQDGWSRSPANANRIK